MQSESRRPTASRSSKLKSTCRKNLNRPMIFGTESIKQTLPLRRWTQFYAGSAVPARSYDLLFGAFFLTRESSASVLPALDATRTTRLESSSSPNGFDIRLIEKRVPIDDERQCDNQCGERQEPEDQRNTDEHFPGRNHSRPHFNARIRHMVLVPGGYGRGVLSVAVEAGSEKFRGRIPIQFVDSLP